VRILSEKLFAILLQITAMNLILYVLSIISITVIGETIPWHDLNLIHLAYVKWHTPNISDAVIMKKNGPGISPMP
jgi:hypothetical protein